MTEISQGQLIVNGFPFSDCKKCRFDRCTAAGMLPTCECILICLLLIENSELRSL